MAPFKLPAGSSPADTKMNGDTSPLGLKKGGDTSPLGLMLDLMQQKWANGDTEGAIAIAKAAAPYVHPRASAAAAQKSPAQMTDAELEEWIEQDDAQRGDPN